MGTNYYLYSNVCAHCNRGDEPRHIGKSSGGWCFSLRIYPEDSINNLSDWMPSLKNPENIIKDEYGKVVTTEELLDTITNRSWPDRKEKPYGYESWDQFYSDNEAVPGPNNLSRHRIGKFCASHGEGTWDCMSRDFS